MAYKIGIDVGGTFTDFLLSRDDGTSSIYKVLSTPKDPPSPPSEASRRWPPTGTWPPRTSLDAR